MRFIKDYLRGDIDLAEAREYAFEKLATVPFLVEEIFKARILNYEEARPYALKGLDTATVYSLFRSGLVTREEARPFIFAEMDLIPDLFHVYVKDGLISLEEAKPYLLKELKSIPENIELYFNSGLFSVEEAKGFVIKAIQNYEDPPCIEPDGPKEPPFSEEFRKKILE